MNSHISNRFLNCLPCLTFSVLAGRLLAIQPYGYAAAESAGDDAIAISYLLDVTRGKGQYFLVVLALLLLAKPLGIHF